MEDLSLGEKIKKARKERHMTLQQLGDRVGVDKSTVLKWETGNIANMRRDKVAAIIKALNMEPAAFVMSGMLQEDTTLLSTDESKLVHIYRNLADNGKKSLMQQAEMHAKVYGNEEESK